MSFLQILQFYGTLCKEIIIYEKLNYYFFNLKGLIPYDS